MPDYKLLYFNIRGRAEPSRLLFTAAGVPFEDQTVPRGSWMELKATLPLGQVPVLYEEDGGRSTIIPHSMAILRHLGRTLGREGLTEADRLQADLCAESSADAWGPLVPHVNALMRGQNQMGLTRTMTEVIPLQLNRLEKIAAQSRSVHGLLVHDVITWVDCLAYHLLDELTLIAPRVLDATPRLHAFVNAFRADPAIAAYLPRQRPSELSVLRTELDSQLAV